MRKTGLTTSRSGELTLSDAEGTLKRRSVDRQQDHVRTSFRYTSPADDTAPNADGTATETGPILTVNSVSNPAAARRVDRSPAPDSSIRRHAPTRSSGHRRTYSTSSERRYSFDDESQQFDWSATLNLINRLDNSQSTTTTRHRPEPADVRSRVRQEAIEPQVIATRVERSTDWEATLPTYTRDRSDKDDWRSRTLSAQRGYSSDSEDTTDWLERQHQRLRQRKSTSTSTAPSTSTIKARIVFPPPRTELERRLIDELRTSQERLNLDKSAHGGPRNGFYSSCTLPRPASVSSLSRGQSLANGFYDRPFSGDTRSGGGRYSTLPSRGLSSGGVQRATSELDFTADTTRHSRYSDTEFDKHRSLTSLRDGDNIVEQRLVKSTVSRRSGAR